MKRKAITKIMTILFLAFTVMALFPLSVKAKEKVTTFTGTETFGHEVLPSYECKDCGATFATYREFQSHREKVHGAAKYYEVVTTPTPTTAREPLPLPTYRCPECGQLFPTLREREAHMNLYHP